MEPLKAHVKQQGHVRLSLPLLMAWSRMKLSGAQRAVLDCLAVECWAFGRAGYECQLTGAEIGRRIDITKRGANKALDELQALQLIEREGRTIRLVPVVPASARAGVEDWYRRVAGTAVPEVDDSSEHAGTNVPERGTTVPSGHKGTRARRSDLTPSSSNTDSNPVREAHDDDEKLLRSQLRSLAHALAALVAARGGGSVEQVLAELRQVAGPTAELVRAFAQVIVAIDDGRVQPKSLRALVGHAVNNPGDYPPVEPVKLLQALRIKAEQAERVLEERKKLDAVLAADLRQLTAAARKKP